MALYSAQYLGASETKLMAARRTTEVSVWVGSMILSATMSLEGTPGLIDSQRILMTMAFNAGQAGMNTQIITTLKAVLDAAKNNNSNLPFVLSWQFRQRQTEFCILGGAVIFSIVVISWYIKLLKASYNYGVNLIQRRRLYRFAEKNLQLLLPA